MALLQVRNCPAELYEQIGQAARQDRRSITQQTVVLISEALKMRHGEQRKGREQAIADLAGDTDEQASMTLDAVELIRQDRAR